MRYITEGGGHQFAYRVLQPDSLISYGYFYTSNVSLHKRLLLCQEEWFTNKLPKPALEDVELGLRLARDGMQLLYAPEATALHLHAMSDDDIFRRQYAVGRSLVNYAMLHPQAIEAKHRTALRWLEIFQHVLGQQPEFLAIGDEISEAAEVLKARFASIDRTAKALERVAPNLTLRPTWAAHQVGEEVARSSQFAEDLYAQRLELAELDGLADEWFGVAHKAPNRARDFLRVCANNHHFSSVSSHHFFCQDIERLRQEFLNSTSWRITAPLRLLGNMLHGRGTRRTRH
jgi:hypothetical protein